MRRTILLSAVTVLALPAVPLACTMFPSTDSCVDYSNCPVDDAGSDGSRDATPSYDALADGTTEAGDDGGIDAPADNADTNPGCDLNGDPKTAPCVVSDAYGLFVSAAGSDAGDGSRAKPYATIELAAVEAVKRGKPRVFLCAGAYDGL